MPVVSQELAEARSIRSAADLLKVPLLVQSRRRDAWERWFQLAGVAHEAPLSTSSVAHFLMLAQAVAAGAGAALLPTFLIEAELATGSLVVPFALPLVEDRHYYLVYPEEHLERLAVRQVRDFICDQARAYAATHAGPA